MSFSNWAVQADTVFCSSPVIPVIQIKEIDQAIPLATALFAGGINALEITLRTPIALEAVRLLVQTFPEALIGVGTIVTPGQLEQAMEMGAKFAFSPGSTQALLKAGIDGNIPFIPGVTSVSELMEGLTLGYTHFKFFPAIAAGGIPMLRSFYGPFPQARFCVTGGINEANFADFLALPNVACVGGSWIVPDEAIKKNDWSLITELCFSARQGMRSWG
ncbi:bifunctional 4-hydroxy-2-oxoglutarate aldolase/2-dehydro-3-deoxy-phosphogluconate aldolase [Legionella saoudiensis]|uniref:bifunctional 4-hydroxy-2-oxoglutarate aldolase/2-dehydro-3-deoxy-phosphogluconate aldolase n=1 Tax=Legionella saoudiensis TaxID=1750561 RepID=UPI0007313CDA|nr:bifunctional 4-hydroxy-2-oxoglutarate aldolase/2-dehydro-3-deoxy-phosphogluconate aldolase [Legionella saoudiensis]